MVLSGLMVGLTACGMGANDNASNHNETGFDWQQTRDSGNITQRVSHERDNINRNYPVKDNLERNLPNRNHLRRNTNNQQEQNVDISASFTKITSEKYPHTRAILVEDAKYSFTEMNPTDVVNLQKKIESELKAKFGSITPQLKQQAQLLAEQQVRKQTQHHASKQEQSQKNENQAQQPAQQPKQNQAQQPAQQPKQNQTQQPAQQPKQNQAQQPTQQPKQNQAQQPTQQPKQNQAQQPAQQNQAKQPTEQPTAPTSQETQNTAGISGYAQQVIDLTNQERAKEGLPALKADAQLSSVALKKSQDMKANNYFSHTSPTYGSPFDMMRDFGVSYKTAGENIAQGQRTPQEVVQAWMNSEGHRKNIMSKDFTHIGVGHETSGNHWTQMFIGK